MENCKVRQPGPVRSSLSFHIGDCHGAAYLLILLILLCLNILPTFACEFGVSQTSLNASRNCSSGLENVKYSANPTHCWLYSTPRICSKHRDCQSSHLSCIRDPAGYSFLLHSHIICQITREGTRWSLWWCSGRTLECIESKANGLCCQVWSQIVCWQARLCQQCSSRCCPAR